ncbi:MAG: NADP-dependent isocitrate dehydrogenase [Candidatus Marinimicrobia bacterium]|nr:NADP-dependent isocitrate dehydrogenase [Candidatus Neomarinimicrobiota bacterium]MDD5540621.1 NADP-dependent isocitrate dehydrogenase [Candidatus Neomarinimicrobiota bacterium]
MSNEQIIFANGSLTVPDTPVIPFIEGDGIGAEICRPTLQLVDAAVKRVYGTSRRIIWREVLAGDKSYQQCGQWLPSATLQELNQYVIGLKGPLRTPVGEGRRSLNVILRQTLDLYACVRPLHWFDGIPAPVKRPELLNVVIFRENTEDLYTGIEFMRGSLEAGLLEDFLIEKLKAPAPRFPGENAFGVKPVSRPGSERLIRAAIAYAIRYKLPSVTLVHKGNIMKFTEGAFRNWGYELAEREFSAQCINAKQMAENSADKTNSKIIIKDMITDAFFQDILLNPARYSVVATLNLNGDYISDLAAAMIGGIGLAPGANINFETGRAIFESTHGTAPDIAGQGTANPASLILSGVMMLEYMGWSDAARHLQSALASLFASQVGTIDIFGNVHGARCVGTTEFVKLLNTEINSIAIV